MINRTALSLPLALLSALPCVANAVEIASAENAVEAFSSYCIGQDAFNAGSEMVADGWISSEDADLIEDEEYRRLLTSYANYMDYGSGDTRVYTRNFDHGAIFLTLDLGVSACGIIPYYDMPADEFLGMLDNNNITPIQVSSSREGSVSSTFYLYDGQAINIVVDSDENDLASVVVTDSNGRFDGEGETKSVP